MSKQMRVHREGEFDYQIVWEDSFSMLSSEIKKLNLSFGKVCIVSDQTVAELYSGAVQTELEKLQVPVDLFTFPAGENNKNIETVKDLYEFLICQHYGRNDLLIALGGGVVGDLTGFAAATYLRGIDFVQIPTTLLADRKSTRLNSSHTS